MQAVFDEETTEFLTSGCALIIGTVDEHGEPHAGRAWGLDVCSDGGEVLVRLLLDADDATTIGHAAVGGAMAVTATSVVTLRSLQLKGNSLGIEAASSSDVERGARYCDDFFGDIVETDKVDRSVVEQITPIGYVACTVAVGQVFDQTPGPRAGAAVAEGR